MINYHRWRKSFLILSLTLIAGTAYHFAVRPGILQWGTPNELRNIDFGNSDKVLGRSYKRAVLIHATPEKVWPWILQLGQERGGFYSYQWLENLFRADMHNVYELRPGLQQPRLIGDTIWLANKHHYNGNGYQIIADIAPNESFVMVGGKDYSRIMIGQRASAAWSIFLYPNDNGDTWLIAQSTSGNNQFGQKLFDYLFFEVPHFIMERKMLLKIKELVERGDRQT